jgi:hypothetical protein
VHVFVEANDHAALEQGVALPLPGAFALMRGRTAAIDWVLIGAGACAGLALATEQWAQTSLVCRLFVPVAMTGPRRPSRTYR